MSSGFFGGVIAGGVGPVAVYGASPGTGPSIGGTLVTVNGAGFAGVTGVLFGAQAASSITVLSTTQLTCVAPAGYGLVPITVVTSSGSATSPTSVWSWISGAGSAGTTGVLTHYTYDLMTYNLLSSSLPFNGVKWGQKLNSPGSWSGTLTLGDSRVQKMSPIQATPPGRTIMIVDLDGAIVWGGVIWTRSYQRSTTALTLGGIEFESYMASRVQAADYEVGSIAPGNGEWWDPTTGDAADACYIAAQVIQDAIDTAGSALWNMVINIYEATSNPNTIIESYPVSQVQTVDTILNDLVEGGYETGFDYGFDVSWADGPGSFPVVACNISYPRRGRIAGSTGLVIGEPFTDYEWPEDGGTAGNSQYATASTASLSAQASDPTPIDDGYPLLEQVQSFSNVYTQSALQAATEGDLAQLEWPIVTPKLTVPAIGSTLAIGDFMMGDDTRVIMNPDERFVEGFDTYARIVQNDVDWPDEGLATMALTLGQLPGLAPIAPLPS